MKLDSPNKALLWRCWRLTRKPAFIGQLCLYAITIPILLVGDFEDQETLDGFIVAALFFYLISVWGSSLRMTLQKPSSWNSVGFHDLYDLRQPVSVVQLVLIPFAYMIGLYLFAYLIPAQVFNWLFGYSGPSLLFSMILVEAVIVTTAATWWSSDAWDGMAAWLMFVGLYFPGWLFPDILQEADDVADANSQVSLSITNIVHYVLINGGAVWITILGVSRQRVGENLLALSESRLFNPHSGITRLASLAFLKGPCPVQSPWRAELWRLQRFRGLSNYALFGMVAALFPCMLLGSVELLGQSSEPVPLEPLIGSSGLAFSIVAMSSTVSFYGMRTSNQKMQFGLFERIRPLETTTLVALNTLTLVAGLLVAAVSMALFLHILGPVFISNFAELRQEIYQILSAWLQQSPGQWLPVIILAPIYLLLASILIATLIIWTTLQPRRSTIIIMAIPCYILVLVIAVVGFNLHESLGLGVPKLWQVHLWFIALLVPAVGLYCLRELNRDQMLRRRQFIPALLLALAVMALVVTNVDLNWLAEIGFPGSLQLALVSSLGLLPLAGFAVILFTINRVLHQ